MCGCDSGYVCGQAGCRTSDGHRRYGTFPFMHVYVHIYSLFNADGPSGASVSRKLAHFWGCLSWSVCTTVIMRNITLPGQPCWALNNNSGP